MKSFAKSKEYWKETASKQKELNKSLTHSDDYLPQLETNAIKSFLNSNDKVLELGCGASDNSIHYMKKVKNYIGVEQIETFVELSNQKIEEANLSNSEILVNDGFEYIKNNKFDADKLITQRFIINLKDRKTQLDFFQNIKDNSLNTKLKLIICEGFEEELINLNKLRNKFLLPNVEIASYNNFFDKEFINELIGIGYKLSEVIKFNKYYFITRLFNTEQFDTKLDIQKLSFEIENDDLFDIDGDISYTKVLLLEFDS